MVRFRVRDRGRVRGTVRNRVRVEPSDYRTLRLSNPRVVDLQSLL